MRVTAGAALLLLVIACSDGVEPADPEFAIADRSLWAGSGMVIESDAFSGLAGTPDVRLEGVSLVVSRTGPEAFEVTLPSTAAGDYVPTITLDDDTHQLPSITVAGFTDSEEYGFTMYLGAEAMRGTGHATLVGARVLPGADEGQLAFVHLDAGTQNVFDGPWYAFDQLRTPGASYRPGVMFGQTADGIRPLTVSGGDVVMEDPIAVPLARQLAELAEGVYLVTSHHQVTVSDGSFTQQMEESQGIALSHEAGRATVWAGNTQNFGLPVFTVPGGSLAYLLTEVFRPTAVEFSPDGELLAVAGSEGAGNMLRIFRASDGELLDEQTLPAEPVALAFDPARDLIYVGLGGTHGALDAVKPSLMVFDRNSFSLLGHMTADASGLACEAGCAEAEIAVSAEPAVYLAGFLNSPLRAFRFSIPQE